MREWSLILRLRKKLLPIVAIGNREIGALIGLKDKATFRDGRDLQLRGRARTYTSGSEKQGVMIAFCVAGVVGLLYIKEILLSGKVGRQYCMHT